MEVCDESFYGSGSLGNCSGNVFLSSPVWCNSFRGLICVKRSLEKGSGQ